MGNNINDAVDEPPNKLNLSPNDNLDKILSGVVIKAEDSSNSNGTEMSVEKNSPREYYLNDYIIR